MYAAGKSQLLEWGSISASLCVCVTDRYKLGTQGKLTKGSNAKARARYAGHYLMMDRIRVLFVKV